MRLPWSTQLYLEMSSERTVFLVGDTVVFDEPTCFAEYPDSSTVVAVGREAAALHHSGQNVVQVERPIRQGRVANLETAQRFLQTILQRADSQLSIASKLIGSSGRYVHPTLASPAELHVFQQVMARAGLSGLQPTPLSQAVNKAMTLNTSTECCTCTMYSDWTELSIFVGSTPIFTSEIEWGTEVVLSMIQKEINQKMGASVSTGAAKQVLQQLIDCSLVTNPELSKQRKDLKMSLKAKEHATKTSAPIIVPQSLFIPALHQVLAPLEQGIRTNMELLDSDVLTAIHSAGIFLVGAGQEITGLPNYLSQALDTEVSWISEPLMAVHTGLRLLD